MTYEPDLSPDTEGLQALVIQPDPYCPIDRLGPWLHDEGITTRTIQPFKGEVIPDSIQQDALVVLGGDMSSLDDHVYPWLSDIRRVVADAASRRKPTLGICLGAQLMAQTFGGTVTKGDRGLEAGVAQISWRAEAAQDQLMAGLPDPFFAGAMHRDMISQLPASAVWLGVTAQYPYQAFRVGEMSWGVQFHPELSPAVYRQWLTLINQTDVVTKERADRGMKAFENQDRIVREHTEALARRFAYLVRITATVAAK
ncbi:type 1 glutamine amidotransferase [Arthrobacter sp. efr-133-TYG-104]|uniref:type 1 glutamine amidotransferase n=1 Tax=Arthrobacter sp. efr-133-TYG-104 TaxID=3040324 RepID=UPI00255172F3|nr:type 1 glutamine amidotransferase [Arthrobacter sp. efr-133-TYG-104]